jgi:hypothetical protein
MYADHASEMALAQDVDIHYVAPVAVGNDTGLTLLSTIGGIAHGVVLVPASAEQSGYRGAIVTYALLVTNVGNISDSYTLTVDGTAFTTAVTPTIVGPLGASVSQSVIVTVKIPVDVASGASDRATVTAISHGDASQLATATLTTTFIPLNPFFDFPSTVTDINGHVYELWDIRTETPATLVNAQFAQGNSQLYELNTHVISLRADGVTKLVWLPLIRQLRRLDSREVEVVLLKGDKLSGEWVRNEPTMYYHESTTEYIVGVQVDEQGRETTWIPWNRIASIENRPAPDQKAKFQGLVHDYLDYFGDTARPVTITRRSYPPLKAIFGFIVDGGGAWSSYHWYTPHHPTLQFWPRNTQYCRSGHSFYPLADKVPLSQVDILEFTDEWGECGCQVLDVSLGNGTVVTGSLISRAESYSGIWRYCYYLSIDSMILFRPYGADSVPLTGVESVEFSTDRVCLWNDGCWWLLGVNYPWLNYGHDFGLAAWPGGSWPHDGMSAPTSRQQVREDLAYLSSKGAHTLRLFVFGDGRASPEFDAQGHVIGFDGHFYADFDTALSLACQYDLHLIPVLLDYRWLDDPQWEGGVQLGGHTDIITNSVKRQSFLDNALKPLLERYGTNQSIIAWEVINEPEWTMRGALGGGTINSTVSIAEMQSFVQDVVDYIHLYASQDATLGSAQGQWLPYWQDMNLDFYQFHYYDQMGQQPPLAPYSSLGLDKPAILGEFPTEPAAVTVTRYLSPTWENGYAGALAWSLNGDDDASNFESHADEFQRWSRAHDTDVNMPRVCEGPPLNYVYLPIVLRQSP